MFKLNTEKDLINFLKILSEESVKKSYRVLKEEDPYKDYYLNKRKTEKDLFEEEEMPPGEIETAPEAPEETAPDVTPPDEEVESDNQTEESFTGSKDRLVDFVNDIRSAPSIKDSMVAEQIDAYYDRLSQEEKDVLVFFLRELSRVMTGKAQGSEARDPSDPPLNIKFVSEDSPEAEASGEETKTPESEDSPESAIPAETSQPGEEDTSAPIRVNESQDHTYIRMKIREILS